MIFKDLPRILSCKSWTLTIIGYYRFAIW
jgi:hypothetical protein